MQFVGKRMKHGLTEPQILALLGSQGAKCALCGTVLIKPCLDHNHTTGKARGFLCSRCNGLLGFVDALTSDERCKVFAAVNSYLLSPPANQFFGLSIGSSSSEMPRMLAKMRGIYEHPKKSGIWWICYFENGRRHREKVGRRSTAIDVYRKRKTQIREGTFFPPQRKLVA